MCAVTACTLSEDAHGAPNRRQSSKARAAAETRITTVCGPLRDGERAMTTRIACDISGWPLIVVHFPSTYSDAEFAEYLGELSTLVGRGPGGLVIDTRNTHPPTPTQRQLLIRFVKTQHKALGRMGGIAFIIDSAVARYAMTAVSWLVAKPCPVEFVSSLNDARAWIAKQKSAAIGQSLQD
jgi:hypothetical protein